MNFKGKLDSNEIYFTCDEDKFEEEINTRALMIIRYLDYMKPSVIKDPKRVQWYIDAIRPQAKRIYTITRGDEYAQAHMMQAQMESLNYFTTTD